MSPRRLIDPPARLLATACVVAVAAFSGTLGWRMHVSSDADQRLCAVLYSLIARSGATIGKPGTPGYAYYQEHPEELELAREQNQAFLDELPCTVQRVAP